MIKKGSMIWVKKILGVAVGIVGIGIIFGIDVIKNIISDYQMVYGIGLLGIAYFLIIAGRRN
jgi:hypothetical protein